MITKRWIKAALIRALKTMAQTAAALIGTDMIGVTDVDWLNVLSVAVVAGIFSALMSIVGLPEVDAGKREDLMQKPELDPEHFEDEKEEDDDVEF